jgi:protein SCO1/2
MIRTPQALIPYLMAAAALMAGILWQAGENVARVGSVHGQGIAAIGGPFSLIDQDGIPRHAEDFRGRFMLVYFGYSYCPDVCPTALAAMADALDKLDNANRVVPIFVTIDPERDSAKVLKDYLKAFGPRFVGLTGDAKSIAAAARAYRVYYKKHPLEGGGYAMDHSSTIYLMGPGGTFIENYDANIGADTLAAALKSRL